MEKKYQYEYPHFAVTVDNVILNLKDPRYIKVLLITRKNEPYKGKLALPGGFLDPEDKSARDGAARELKEETNLSLSTLVQVCALTKEGRDPRERCISIVYEGIVYNEHEEIKAKDDAATVKWVSLQTLKKNDLAFDHALAIKKTLDLVFLDDKTIMNFLSVNEQLVRGLRSMLDTIKFNLSPEVFPVL